MKNNEHNILINIDSYLIELNDANSSEEIDSIREKYENLLNDTGIPVVESILRSGITLAVRGIEEDKRLSMNKRIAALSQQEQAELNEVVKIIDENRFVYHFQPIVKASNGEIYSYEALMRPVSEMKLSPYHIIKYAELTDRLDDIERATFINVLNLIDSGKICPQNCLIFINSIPNTRLDISDQREVLRLMLKHDDKIVIELTEESELDEYQLNDLRERYRNMGIQLALDDYGTGYSNVSNLLRYTPDIVKIDRSLITDIHNDPKKRHFFRDIVDFCHSNSIKALAEGVETSEELRTVIMMGADLIQGFYTARPAPELIQTLPKGILSEIQTYRKELELGSSQRIYYADSYETISLDKLVEQNLNRLILGKNGDGEVTVTSSLLLDVPVQIETTDGYSGTLVLKNSWISNMKNRSCIVLGDNNNLTLVLKGENTLDNGGILVPKTSVLTLKGDGNLNISLDSDNYFAIGNDPLSFHGVINFDQSGCITIKAHGPTGVAIGSGSGGEINIIQGQYVIEMRGENGLGIGSLYTDTNLDIHDCDIGMELYLSKGAAIGSMGACSNVSIRKTSAKIYISGYELVGIGTVSGDHAKISFTDANILINMRGQRCSAVAALDGTTKLDTSRIGLRIVAGGDKVLGFGGFSKDPDVTFYDTDINVRLETSANTKRCATEIVDGTIKGKYKLTINGEELLNSDEA